MRPTAERVREAWLQILGNELPDARVLDLFAGSGALGLEALSRGAAHATFVELNPSSLAALRENIVSLDAAERASVKQGDALRVAAHLDRNAYDIVLADPPFTIDYADRLVALWRDRPFAPILTIEHSAKTPLPGGETRRWGDIAVTFFRVS